MKNYIKNKRNKTIKKINKNILNLQKPYYNKTKKRERK